MATNVRGSRRPGGRRWLGAGVSAVVVVLACSACGTPSGTAPPSGSSVPTSTVPTSTVPTTTSTTSPPPSTTAVPPTSPPTSAPTTTVTTPAAPLLSLGDRGPAVAALQRRLAFLGYWTGTTAGYFGDSTQQAVYALQKAAGLETDGVVGPRTDAALREGTRPTARSRGGYVIEIDLADDLLLFVDHGVVEHILNTSTGGGYLYTSDGVTAVATTPQGVFHIFRQVDGLVVDSLGTLWRPKFFVSGFAIHGNPDVPPVPVSHGCVRVSNEAIDWIWAAGLAPIGTEVFVYR